MSTIIWAKTDWHCWTMPLTGYPVSESGDYTPEVGFSYQINYRNRDRFSVLNDAGAEALATCRTSIRARKRERRIVFPNVMYTAISAV